MHNTNKFILYIKDKKTGETYKVCTKDVNWLTGKVFDFTAIIEQLPDGPDNQKITDFKVVVGDDPNPPPPPPPPTENEIKLTPIAVKASKQDEGKEAAKVMDGRFDTRWSAEGDGEWIEFTFDNAYRITEVDLSGFHLHKTYYFEINGKKFENKAGRKEGELTVYNLKDLNIVSNKIRVVGHGNNTTKYNSYREITFYGLPLDDPVAVIKAPKVVYAGDNVVLNGVNSIATDLKIFQIGGPEVFLKVAGPFKQSFTVPNVDHATLIFRAVASKGKRQSSTDVYIKVDHHHPHTSQ